MPKNRKGKKCKLEFTPQNGLENIKIIYEITKLHKLENLENQLINNQKKIWQFEYTGSPISGRISNTSGSNASVWSEITTHNTAPNQFKQYTIGKNQHLSVEDEFLHATRGKQLKIKRMPTNSSQEEIIAVIKGAMVELSDYLLYCAKKKLRKQLLNDDDLDRFCEYNNSQGSLSKNSEQAIIANEDQLECFNEINGENNQNIENSTVSDGESEYPDDCLVPTYADTVVETTQFDLVELVYNRFIHQENNGASWLGGNNKLTRLKFSGGLESILRIQLTWPQLDSLWTVMDYQRTGEIDMDEFKAMFGDLSEFFDSSADGAGTLSLTTTMGRTNGNRVTTSGGVVSSTRHESMQELTKCLYQLCNTLRQVHFTVRDMFAGFDRDGSGSVSISEFCSLLRIVVGKHAFTKRNIYRALLVLDSNGDKSISIDEFESFVYSVWRTQIDDIGTQLRNIAIEDSENNNHADILTYNKQCQQMLIEERNGIKEAIRLNFDREKRNKLEKMLVRDEKTGHIGMEGPFQSILHRMGIQYKSNDSDKVELQCAIGNSHINDKNGKADDCADRCCHSEALSLNDSIEREYDCPVHHNKNQQKLVVTVDTIMPPLLHPSVSSKQSSPRMRKTPRISLATAGSNQLKRYTIMNNTQWQFQPTRSDCHGNTMELKQPVIKDLNAGLIMSGESVSAALKNIGKSCI